MKGKQVNQDENVKLNIFVEQENGIDYLVISKEKIAPVKPVKTKPEKKKTSFGTRLYALPGKLSSGIKLASAKVSENGFFSNKEKAAKKDSEHKKKKTIILLQARSAIVYLIIAIALSVGIIYALFSDMAHAEANIQAGTLLVKLVEDAPFNNLAAIPEEGTPLLVKTFWAESESNVNMYVRSKIIPVIEAYDEEEECYVVINIDIKDVILDVQQTNWVHSNGYYYYNQILEPEQATSHISVTFVGFSDQNDYEDMNVRVTLRVELEAAQVQNDLWKGIFNIETLPF